MKKDPRVYLAQILECTWRVIENELPDVKAAISGVLPPLDQLERELADNKTNRGNEPEPSTIRPTYTTSGLI